MTDGLDGWDSTEGGWTREYKGMRLTIQELGEPEGWVVTVTSEGAEGAVDVIVTGDAAVAADEAIRLADLRG